MDYDLDYDMDYPADIYEDYEYEFSPTDYTLSNLWEDCLKPTITDGFSSSSKLLVCCILMKISASLSFLPSNAMHIASTIFGIYCLNTFFGFDLLYILLFGVIGYITLFLTNNNIFKQNQGTICVIVCFVFIITCELFLVEKKLWHKIRGSQMIIAMKLISLAFDTSVGSKDLPHILPIFGYLLNPGSVIFGPWISYSTYCNSPHSQNLSILWGLLVFHKLFRSFIFLTVSTCWTSWFLGTASWKWFGAYRDALSFRSSHYFVSYLSESTLISSGMGNIPVVSSLDIEFPRSLVEVVINWNIPMHFWLKTYVFKTTKPLGNFAAVLMTYAASSLLHGLNFQLSAVLLSLGFYTYIEHVLRKKVSEAFNSCTLARKCKPECNHKYKSNHFSVMTANVLFSALAMFHLAYLGVMFDSSSSLEEEGYNMQHTLKKWFELNFASHWVAGFMYFLNVLI